MLQVLLVRDFFYCCFTFWKYVAGHNLHRVIEVSNEYTFFLLGGGGGVYNS